MEMFDYHTHIGQFYNAYYEPHTVIEVMSECGTSGCLFSSTTSCLAWNSEAEKKTIVSHIRDEVNEALETAERLGFNARALCWIIPQWYFDGESVAAMANECCYSGFKIHTRSHNWDLQDIRICKLMDEICEYAVKQARITTMIGSSANTSRNKLTFPILIHCGEDDFENPRKFENWFAKFPEAQFVLAHSRPCGDTLAMLQKYKNVFCDTAFATTETVATICNAGFSDRILFGTDFPITHYWETRNSSGKTADKKTLAENYRQLATRRLERRLAKVFAPKK